jgi:acetyltransferase-like isoleucine patch superfamily enzyme
VFQSHTINSSPANLSISHPNIFLEPGAEIRNSYVSDGLYMERHSGLNRTTTVGPCGIGSFSYVSDAHILPFSHIGPRSSIGGFEHPHERVSQSSFFWGQNTFFWQGKESAPIPAQNSKPETKKTTLEADVWIGANCVVKAGIRLRTGSVIGAGSVLTKDTEPYGIYVGNPAKLIKHRFKPDVVQSLINSEWWELPFAFLMSLNLSNTNFFLESINRFKARKHI